MYYLRGRPPIWRARVESAGAPAPEHNGRWCGSSVRKQRNWRLTELRGIVLEQIYDLGAESVHMWPQRGKVGEVTVTPEPKMGSLASIFRIISPLGSNIAEKRCKFGRLFGDPRFC